VLDTLAENPALFEDLRGRVRAKLLGLDPPAAAAAQEAEKRSASKS